MLKKSIIKHITQGALTKNNMGFYILLGSHHTYYIYNEQKYAHACIYESFNLPLWDSIKRLYYEQLYIRTENESARL